MREVRDRVDTTKDNKEEGEDDITRIAYVDRGCVLKRSGK